VSETLPWDELLDDLLELIRLLAVARVDHTG
jgi:hypothetical protein